MKITIALPDYYELNKLSLLFIDQCALSSLGELVRGSEQAFDKTYLELSRNDRNPE